MGRPRTKRTPKSCGADHDPASRIDARNSAHATAFRRAIQEALPTDSGKRIAIKLEHAVDQGGVYEQVEGRHRFSLDVASEAAAVLAIPRRRELWDRHLAPYGLGVHVRPTAAVEAGTLLAANSGLLGAIGGLEQTLSEATADAHIDDREANALARAIVEARTRLEILEARVFGGRR